jgi:hypothetical protein
MSLEKEGEEEPKAATKQVKRKNPDDVWAKVTEFKQNMDDMVVEALNLFEEHDIPPDWTTFEPCDDEGDMTWVWQLNKNRYRLRIYVSTELAVVESDGERSREMSLGKAVRRLRRMMDDDEEEDD